MILIHVDFYLIFWLKALAIMHSVLYLNFVTNIIINF